MKNLLLLSALLAAACLADCASINPVKAGCGQSSGQTLETCAFSIYGTFAITEQQAAKLVADPAVPVQVKQAIQAADRAASPVLESAQALIMNYEQQAAAAAKGGGGQGLVAATADLQGWVTQAQSQLSALLSSMQGKPPP